MIDLYGRIRAAQNGNPIDAPLPYEQEYVYSTVAGVGVVTEYTRFANTTKCAIWRKVYTKDSSGNIVSYVHTITVANWADRKTLDEDAWKPINECWDLNA